MENILIAWESDAIQGDITNMKEKRNDRCGLLHMDDQEKVKDSLTDAHIMFVILARIFLNEPDSSIV